MTRILIVGGYGAFGERAAERLARTPGLDIIVAGRSEKQADACVARLAKAAKARISGAAVDATRVTAAELSALGPSVVINASGPFQAQDYDLPRAAIAARCHYIDLADARGFVTGITALDAEAKAAGVAVISGASTVPGLSSAVVRHYAGELARLDTLDIGISPGNSFDPGLATTQSILGGAGKKMPVRLEGRTQDVVAWQGLHAHEFPVIGRRWMGYADVPDLDLFPERYPTLATVRVWASVEVGLFHLGIWALSGLVRAGVLGSLKPLSRPLLAVKRGLGFLGTDQGGMFVVMGGTGHSGGRKEIAWHLIARHGDGPFIPAIPSVLLARRLARAELKLSGAMPCFELFTFDEFMVEVADLDIGAMTR